MTEPRPISRRRALTIIAAAGALPVLAGARSSLARPASNFTWRGTVMGADASMTFYDASRGRAQESLHRCLAEVHRLEDIFSLSRAHSEICQLNRHGIVDGASQDLRRLLALSRNISHLTGGAFDPSVQPIWRLNADWFAAHPGSAGPPLQDITQARRLIDYRAIRINNGAIHLGHGQSITLNGIAQGYITDRIADLLRAEGWNNLLLDLGEYRTLDGKADGAPFRISLAGSACTVPLANMALASSAASGFVFPSPLRNHSHLVDPRSGRSPGHWRAIHVRHRSAAVADGLSTACSAMTADEIAKTVKAIAGISVWAQSHDGRMVHLHGHKWRGHLHT